MVRIKYSKILSIIFSILFIYSIALSVPLEDVHAAEAITIYASKIKTETSDYYDYNSDGNYLFLNTQNNIDFVIDEDIDLNGLFDNSDSSSDAYDLVIKGDKTLTIKRESSNEGLIHIYANYIQENGSNVVIEDGMLSIENGTIDIKSGAKLSIACDIEHYICISGDKDITLAGDVTLNNKCDLNELIALYTAETLRITGGNVSITACTCPVSVKNLNISGGNIKITSRTFGAIIALNNISISGGYLETSVTETTYGDVVVETIPNIYTIDENGKIDNSSINIASSMYVKEPDSGKVSTINVYGDYKAYHISDSSGNIPKKIIITEKPAEEKKTDTSKDGSDEKSKDTSSKASNVKYSNEWVNGKWYDANGNQTYPYTLSWKSNSTGWWIEDSSGWYPISSWQKIDGKWYYFTETGYMDYSEYRDGCWLGNDGAWDENYSGGHWGANSTGWWYEDSSGWYPAGQWLWIDGSCYYFKSSGYMAVSEYIDGCWLGSDGAWVN